VVSDVDKLDSIDDIHLKLTLFIIKTNSNKSVAL